MSVVLTGFRLVSAVTSKPALARRRDQFRRLFVGPDGERGVDAGLANVQVEALAEVLDLDQIGAALGEHRQQPGQAAGAVVDPGEDRQAPSRLVLPPPDQARHEPEVDIAARQHHAGHPVGRPGRPRPAISAATPTAPAPSATSLARSISSTMASAIASSSTVTISSIQRRDERTGDLAGMLHRDPVGQRQHRTVGHRVAAVRGAHAGLDTDHRDVGEHRLDGDGQPGGEPAPAERDDDRTTGRSMSSSSSRPSVPCPAITATSSNGGQKLVPLAADRSSDSATASFSAAPCSITVAP